MSHCRIQGEVVGADAFQIYQGLEILSAKPGAKIMALAPHHLIGTVSLSEEMNAEKFRRIACHAIREIQSRGKQAIVVGGSGLYLKALTHGLLEAPPPDPRVREELNDLTLDELGRRLMHLDPKTAERIDLKNRRRLVRAIEICLLTGKPLSGQRTNWESGYPRLKKMESGAPAAPSPLGDCQADGVFVFRDRDELYRRINRRVEEMFAAGVIDEVARAGASGATASRIIGLAEIRQHLEGKLSIAQCVQAIQQATRQYAKRQLTWFRRQTNFQPLNLSLLSHAEAVEWISRRALARRA